MARIAVSTRPPSLFARVVFWFVKRKLGRIPGPVRLHALHGPVFGGYARMEMAQDKASRVPAKLKSLVSIRAAMLVGCPF